MKKLTLLTIIIISILGCSNLKEGFNYENEVGIKTETANPNTPFIYKNGYKNFEIKQILSLNTNDSLYINQLRFNAVLSAMYTQNLMYNKFGKWDKEIWLSETDMPILMWENRKLIDSQSQLFTVFVSGTESWKEIYASVIVFDSKDQDCLSEISENKNLLIKFFSTEIRNLNSNKKFYDLYWKTVNDYKENK
jgi:hypothetical protein